MKPKSIFQKNHWLNKDSSFNHFHFQALQTHYLVFPFLLLAILSSLSTRAQQANLYCNTNRAFVDSNFSDLDVTSTSNLSIAPPYVSSVTNEANVTSNSVTDNATVSLTGIGAKASIRVTDLTVADQYNAGTYVGFRLRNGSLGINLLGSLKLRTLLNGAPVDSSTSNTLLGISTGLANEYEVSFISNSAFDAVEIQFNAVVGILTTYNVYNAVLRKYCQGPALTCNTPVSLALPGFPAAFDAAKSQFSILNLGTITDPGNAIDNNPSSFASVDLTGSGTANFAIKDQVKDYTAGLYTGFDIESGSLIGLSLLTKTSILTYLNGVRQDSVGGNSLLSAPSSLLSGSGRQRVGLITTLPFDEVQLRITSSVAVSATNIYSAFIDTFCAGAPLVCNTQTILGAPNYPVYVNGQHTGTTGAAILNSVNNTDNAIDTDPSTYATIVISGALATGSLSVKDQLNNYVPGTFAGFDIEDSSLVAVNALGGVTITTYLEGVQKQAKSGTAALASVSSTLLTGTSRQIVGFVSDSTFDEVQITLDNGAALSLGATKVYSAIIEKLCKGTIACGSSYALRNPAFPVVIDGQKTGFGNVACALCTITNTNNVIDMDSTNFATIAISGGVAGSGTIAVKDPISSYPAGSFAGFAIRDVNSLIKATLLGTITISTYRHDTLLETNTAGNLINLNLLINIFGTPSGRYNLGFITTKAFDEISITVNGISVLHTVEVYGAIIDTRSASGGVLNCRVLNPDFNVTLINVAVPGNVSTNDKIAAGTTSTYGTPVPVAGNPAGGTISMNPDGTYSFTGTSVGVFKYLVPVCADSQTNGCAMVPLTITVNNSNITTNPPIVNTDIATTQETTPVTVKTLANDACGNPGCSLNPATVTAPARNTPGGPSHGSISINTTTGDITYTADAGFIGVDTLIYTVCDNQAPAQCRTAYQFYTVEPNNAENTTIAADDYVTTARNVTVSGNVKTNDIDPEGNATNVTPQTTTVTGKGTLTLTNTGSFNFVPVSTFTGPIDFTYATCDDGTPQACATATLHILVKAPPPAADLTSAILNDGTTMLQNGTRDNVINIFNIGTGPTTNPIIFAVAKITPQYDIIVSDTTTMVDVFGGTPVNNADWTIVEQATRFVFTSKSGVVIPQGGSKSVGVTIKALGIPTSTANLSILIAFGTGGAETPNTNNRDNNIFAIN